jgi:hypothetical protein
MAMPMARMVGRSVVAVIVAAAMGSASCAGHLRHTTQPHSSVRENWTNVTRVPVGTLLRVEEKSGLWITGWFVAAEPQEIRIKVNVRSSYWAVPRSEIRQILMQHTHTDWTGIGDVAGGAIVGGFLGGLAVPQHRVIAGTLMAGVGAFTGVVVAIVKMFDPDSNIGSPKQDEIIVYYSDRVATVPTPVERPGR